MADEEEGLLLSTEDAHQGGCCEGGKGACSSERGVVQRATAATGEVVSGGGCETGQKGTGAAGSSACCSQGRCGQNINLAAMRRWKRGEMGTGPALVWSPLPCIALLFPPMGHVGILRGDGALLDFSMSYLISLDAPDFGKPTRIAVLPPKEIETEEWDAVIQEAVKHFQHEQYNILTTNCHYFVAHCLNRSGIPGPLGLPWNTVTIALFMFFRSRFVSRLLLMRTYIPFLVTIFLGWLIFGMPFIKYWAIGIGALCAWYLCHTALFQWRP